MRALKAHLHQSWKPSTYHKAGWLTSGVSRSGCLAGGKTGADADMLPGSSVNPPGSFQASIIVSEAWF